MDSSLFKKKILPSLILGTKGKSFPRYHPGWQNCPAHMHTMMHSSQITAEVPAVPTRVQPASPRPIPAHVLFAGLPLPPARCQGCHDGTCSRSSTFFIFLLHLSYIAEQDLSSFSLSDIHFLYDKAFFIGIILSIESRFPSCYTTVIANCCGFKVSLPHQTSN